MSEVEGYVTVFECSDGGSGDPRKSFWQFFIGDTPVGTENPYIAETMKIAIQTCRQVRVSYDPANGNRISQARLQYEYICYEERISRCSAPPSPPVDDVIHETRRLAPGAFSTEN